MSKYVYKLEPKPLYETTKEIVPLYYNTEQEAYEARAALWANGEISPWSEITRINLETDIPIYKGIILKAELIPPKCTIHGWRINMNNIMPVPYREFADLIYKYDKDKDKYDSLVILNAKSVLDLRHYLPYISPEDSRGRRFFYDYFYDNTLRNSERIMKFLVKEAYEEYIKNNEQDLESSTENFVVPKETFDNTSTDFYQLIPIKAKESNTNMTPSYYRTFDEASEARSVLWAEGKISTKSVITKIELEKESPKYQGVILKTKLIAPKNLLDGYKITDLSDIEPISFKDFIQLYYNTDNKEIIEENANITEIKKILPCVKKENEEVFFYTYFSDDLFRFACYSRGNLICMIMDEFDKYKKYLVNIF